MEDNIVLDVPSTEEKAQHYKAAMDSVNLLNDGKPNDMSDDEWADTVSRNVEHLQIIVAKEWWTTEDLTPFTNVISANS
jgi:hypothetical protein